MKICIVYEFFYPFVGGIETHILEFAKYAISKGHEVHVVALNYGFRAEENYQGIHIHRVGKSGDKTDAVASGISVRRGSLFRRVLSMPKISMQALRIVQKYDIDIINPHLFISGLITYPVGKLKRKPVVVTWHGTYGKAWRDIMGSKWKGDLMYYIERNIVRLKPWNKLITIDDGTGGPELALEVGVKPSDMLVLHHGVDEKLFYPRPKPEELMQELGMEDKKVVLFAHRLTKLKGADLLLSAASLVIERMRDVKFLVVGGGEMKEQLIKSLEDMGIRDNFVFLDSQPHEKMPDFFALADVCCYLALHSNLSLSCLESLSCGKADVITNTGQTSKIIKNNYNGILVESDPKEIAEGIIKVLNDNNLKRTLEKNARDFIVKNLTREKMYSKILDFYERALE